MFGTLKPQLCKIPSGERTEYRRAYCGTCKALGDHHGFLTRPLLSYDVVFLGHVLEALAETPAAQDRCRCPIAPVVLRPTFASDSVPMKVAAAVQVVLADQWLDDQVRDGKARWRPARWLTRPKANRAMTALSELGLDFGAAAEVSASQTEVESSNPSLEACARPTAELLENLFRQLPEVEGIKGDSEALAELGFALGSGIYVLDAIEDLEDDLRSGQFNMCIEDGALSVARYESARAALRAAIAQVASSVDSIAWQRNASILESVVVGLRRRAENAIAKANALAASSSPIKRRWLPGFVLAIVALFVGAGRFFARRWRHRKHRRSRRQTVCQAAPMMAVAGGPPDGPPVDPPPGGDVGKPAVLQEAPPPPQDEETRSSGCSCCGDCCDECCSCDCTGCECMRGDCCSCDCLGDGCCCDCDCCNCD